mgnify:CR=1 FL=1
MNIDYSKQLDYKKDKVINIFLKYAKMNINPIIVSSDKYNYRNKILLHVSNGKLGLYKNNSHDLVQAYGETEINAEDVKKAYETIERTKAEREQTGKKNNFEGR